MKALILYSSTTGNTKAVAQYMANKTGGTAADVKDAPADISGYDTVILGSRVHAAGISKNIVKFAEERKDELAQKNVAFYLCCMFTDEKADAQVKTASEKLGISKGTYFVGGKKLAEDGKQIDEFLAGIQ
ncbi:MAG: flavodoxin domain-containing protein [Candidatus Methanomethylophilaceae archaeon]